MGSLRYLLEICSAFAFYIRTGLSKHEAKRVFQALSNLYLTPDKPGRISYTDRWGREVVASIITSTGRMSLKFEDSNEPFFIDRTSLKVGCRVDVTPWYQHTDDFPMWDPSSARVLDFVKTLAHNGIPLKPNTDGVTYYRMPGEGQA